MRHHFTLFCTSGNLLRAVALIAVWSVLVLLAGACDQLTTSRRLPPPAPSATPTPIPNPPVTITLRQIGIRRPHETFGFDADDIRLLVTVDDGSGQPEVRIVPPEGAAPFKVKVDEPAQVNQVVFRAPSAGERLRLTIVAIEEDDASWIGPVAAAATVASGGTLMIAAAILADPSVQEALGGNDPVGYYEAVWYPQDRWGSGRYEAVGNQDLLLWFDINVGGEVRRLVSGAPETPSPTPTRPGLTPTPTLPTPTPMAEPDYPSNVAVVVRPTGVRVSDDRDPFTGAGEIYVVVAVSDEDGPLSVGTNAPSPLSLNDGDSGFIDDVQAGVAAPGSNIRVYLGVWEQDSTECYASFLSRTLGGGAESLQPWTFDTFVDSIVGLGSCGDDLIGHETFTLAADLGNWGSGSDAVRVGDGIATSQRYERPIGDSTVTLYVEVLTP